MAADKQGREKFVHKRNAVAMCNSVGYGFKRMPSLEAAISVACRKSLFYSAEFQCEQLEQMCVDIVHSLDVLCGDSGAKFCKSTCSPKVSSAMAFIVAAVRVRCITQRVEFSRAPFR